MPARETEAIILKTFPLGEADRLVSFLGRTSGRMRGVAAGARRLKNRYGSTLELLSHVRIWYFERETRDLVRIQQAELLDSLNKAQSDYSLSTGLALVSEVAEQVLAGARSQRSHVPAHPAHREGDRAAAAHSALPLSYFAFWTVRLAGWLPRFDLCALCGKPFGKGIAYQDAYHPGLFDAEHRRSGMKPVSFEARELAEVFAKQRLDQFDEALATLPGVKELREAGLELDRASHGTKAGDAEFARDAVTQECRRADIFGLERGWFWSSAGRCAPASSGVGSGVSTDVVGEVRLQSQKRRRAAERPKCQARRHFLGCGGCCDS